MTDPVDPLRVICEDCKNAHEELMLDYENRDNPWKSAYDNDNESDEELYEVLQPHEPWATEEISDTLWEDD